MKRIILLLDGTWNDADQGPSDTNIVRLREIIARCLRGRPNQDQTITPASSANRMSISAGTYLSFSDDQPIEHLVYYERGVGTGGFLDLLFGGAFGSGLSRNIRKAYRFLSQHYEAGDEVFVFGFSRGSYTARSLVGYLNAAGLLHRNLCTVENESLAWSHYRTSPSDRVWKVAKSLESWSHNNFAVSCVGVFDTVGALGVPAPIFWRENRDLFEFHDVGLANDQTQYLHALAIDEHRLSFEPALWRKPKFGGTAPQAEQVWFAGAHSDVGGGNVDEERGRKSPALDDITLDWMIKRVLRRFPNFPVKQNGSNAWPKPASSAALAAQDEPRRRFYRVLPFAWRSIDNALVHGGIRDRVVARDRHAETIGEAIHISAIERLGQTVHVGAVRRTYAPVNLISALDNRLAQDGTEGALSVVDYDGNILPSGSVKQCVSDARVRLLEAEALRLT